MKFLLKATIFLLLALITLADNDALPNVGPVVNVMENLADNTVEIVDEIHDSLKLKMEHNADNLLGNIQVITTNAMVEMADAFIAANQKLPNCPQSWTMQELQKRLDEQLLNCTSNLNDLRTVFTGQSTILMQGIQAYITELANIPAYCELQTNPNSSATSFASSTVCFVENLTELNRNVGQLISQANTSLLRTRKLARTGVDSSTECTSKVVENFINFLNEAFENC